MPRLHVRPFQVLQVFDPARGNTQVLHTIAVTSGGNPKLKPQNGLTRSASVDLEMPGVKGLKLSANYVETQIDDQVVFGTVSFPIITQFFPERLTRAPLTPADQALGYTGGLITAVDAAEPTVKHQVSACLRKFGLPSRMRLIAALR